MFVALFPDAESRARLARAARDLADEYGGRPVPPENMHVTLRFLGNVPPVKQPCLERLLGGICLDAFHLTLDGFEYRVRQKMVWAVPQDVPGQLYSLADGIEKGACACGLPPADHAFLPHLTLIRKVARKPVLGSLVLGVEARFSEVCLVESMTLPEGSKYTVVKRRLLRGGSGD